ncbi:MAG: zinc protease [Chlamydiales bacterium]|jgi:zinc protease
MSSRGRLGTTLLGFALAQSLSGLALGAQEQATPLPEHPRDILIPALPLFATATPRQIDLGEGHVISVIPSDSGLLHGMLRFRTGTADEAPGAIGVATLLADVMRYGGSAQHPGVELDAWMAERGASLTIEADVERFEVRFTCLPADWDGMFERLTSVLDSPALDPSQLQNARRRMVALLARQRTTPELVADRALALVVYGTDSPLARRPSQKSLAAITPTDLAAFHGLHILSRDVVVGLVGLPSDDQLQTLVRLLAGPAPGPDETQPDATAAPPRPAAPRQFSGFIHPARTRVWIVDRPDALHTEVRVAAPGLRRLDPEASVLELWSRIVGQGGRAHRLGRRFPERSIEAGFRPEWSRAGAFTATFNAPNADVRGTLAGLIDTLERSLTTLSRDEIDRVRQRLMNEELSATDSRSKALKRSLDLAFHGYAEDYYRQRLLSWRNATPEVLSEAARKRLNPARLVIVAVGPIEQLREQLGSLGQVEELQLERALAPGGSQPDEVETMLSALGGRQAWADAAAIHAQIDIVLPSREIPSRQWSDLSGPRFRAEYLMASETVVLVVDAQRMLQVTASGTSILSAEAHRNQLASKRRSLWQILHRLARSAGLRARLDADHNLVIRDDEGMDVVLELDDAGIPVRLTDRSGEQPVTREFLDWSHDGPLAFPTRIALRSDGIEWRIATFEALAEFDPLLLVP